MLAMLARNSLEDKFLADDLSSQYISKRFFVIFHQVTRTYNLPQVTVP